MEVRKSAALYDSYQMTIDDLDIEEHDSLDGLCSQLCARTEIKHPVWQRFFPMEKWRMKRIYVSAQEVSTLRV